MRGAGADEYLLAMHKAPRPSGERGFMWICDLADLKVEAIQGDMIRKINNLRSTTQKLHRFNLYNRYVH